MEHWLLMNVPMCLAEEGEGGNKAWQGVHIISAGPPLFDVGIIHSMEIHAVVYRDLFF